jgi:hypothetical protein
MQTETPRPRSWHSRKIIHMPYFMFFRCDWQSAWIAISIPFVQVCRLYLYIGEDAWLQLKRMTIHHAFYSPINHVRCLPDSECPFGLWNVDTLCLNESWLLLCGQRFWCTKESKHAQESTICVCLLYGNYSDSCLQSDIFLYIWCRHDTEKYGSTVRTRYYVS